MLIEWLASVFTVIAAVLATQVLGKVTLVVVAWVCGSLIGFTANALGWIDARVDSRTFAVNPNRYNPIAYPLRKRELEKDVRNEWLGAEVQAVFLVVGILVAVAQQLDGEATPKPNPFAIFGPLLFLYAEGRLVYGSIRNRIDRHIGRFEAQK